MTTGTYWQQAAEKSPPFSIWQITRNPKQNANANIPPPRPPPPIGEPFLANLPSVGGLFCLFLSFLS
jgi:hypothetical protein